MRAMIGIDCKEAFGATGDLCNETGSRHLIKQPQVQSAETAKATASMPVN